MPKEKLTEMFEILGREHIDLAMAHAHRDKFIEVGGVKFKVTVEDIAKAVAEAEL